jgi:hypothetical protein
MDLAAPAFQPRAPWVTGDLQTLRNFVLRPRVDLDAWPMHRLWLPLPAGPEPPGDQMSVALHAAERLDERPLIVLIHGLTGCEDSIYLRASARFWLQRGHPVARLNLRGNRISRARCRGHYHGGRAEDLAAVLRELIDRDRRVAERGIVPIGFSLGGNVLIRLLAETARELPIRAAASVSAPIDLAATSDAFHRPRNALYLAWLLSLMKREALLPPAELSPVERRAVRAARTVRQFDNGFIARRFGFDGADDYYRRCSGLRFLPEVDLPLLLLHARDDPWIPAAAYERAAALRNRHLRIGLTPGGGHVGFHGADDPHPWHDRAIAAFLREAG